MVQEKKRERIGIRTVLNNSQSRAIRFLEPVINKVTGMSKVRDLYEKRLHGCGEQEFIDRAMDALRVRFDIDSTELENIPTEGPVIVVANHPFGAHDALLMSALLKQKRNDYKIMANGFFSAIEEMRDRMILVNAFDKNNSANSAPLRESVRHLKNGGVLGIFPSGTVSHLSLKKRRITDPEWSETLAGLVQMTGATVVPVHFSGRNSLPFNVAGLIHPMLRTALLPRELLKKKGEIKVHIGRPISGAYLSSLENRKHMTDYIRMRCYLLKDRQYKERVVVGHGREADIIPEVDRVLLQNDIDNLPVCNHLHSYKDFEVFYARAEDIPNVLTEIGRLREITFREVGEGTGRSMDIDEYDYEYLHLFVWNRQEQEILGAYRMGEVDRLAGGGDDKLYTSEFYEYTNTFLDKYSNALEMGRSFVRKEYQKKPYSLMLLWRGICSYVAKFPHYRYLFGAVSVSNEYDPKSRALIANLLIDKEVNLKSRMPVNIRINKEVREYCKKYSVDNPQDISVLVKSIEEDGKDVPVLVRQYMKLGGKFLSFCIDKEFNSTLDGLIVVDLPNAPVKSLKMYMGDDIEAYLERYKGKKGK